MSTILLPAMATACVAPRPLYRPRDAQVCDLWPLLDAHFDSFQRVYDERYQAKYGYWRPIVQQSVAAFLKCGDLQQGFARVRCPDFKHEMFVAFSCQQRGTCPSCHQKPTLLTALHVANEVCSPVAHRQVVLCLDVPQPGSTTSARARGCGARHDCGDSDAWRTPALVSSHPCATHLRRVYTRGRFSGVAPVRYGATVGRLAGSGLRAVPGRGEDRTGSRREHAQLATQQFQCGPVSVSAGARSGGHRASASVHDTLSIQSVAASEGQRHGAGRLPGREAGLPRLS